VLVLTGAQDESTPPSMIRSTFEACKYGDYRELYPGTHMMVIEQADEVAKEYVAFRHSIGNTSAQWN
jgi:3-oxoadipate enol-lactonase